VTLDELVVLASLHEMSDEERESRSPAALVVDGALASVVLRVEVRDAVRLSEPGEVGPVVATHSDPETAATVE